MKFTVIFSICFLLAMVAIQQAKTGFDTIKQAKSQQNQAIAMAMK